MKGIPSFEAFDRSMDREEEVRRNTRPVEIAAGLWGRLGTKARREGLTRGEAITAALVAFVDGPEACGRYLEKIGKAETCKPGKKVAPSARNKPTPPPNSGPPWAPFMTGPPNETREARQDRLRQALALRFPGKMDLDRQVPMWESLAFLQQFK